MRSAGRCLRHALAGVVAVGAVAVSFASAQLVDGGFEADPAPPGTAEAHNPGETFGGWTVLPNGGAVLTIHTTYSEPGPVVFTAQEGQNHLDLTGAGNTGLNTGVFQAVPTTPGTLYDLTFFVGRASGSSFYTTPSTVDLSIDAGPRISFTNGNATPNTINWQQFTHQFTAAGSSTTLTFLNGTSNNSFAGLDAVSLAVVPEPLLAPLAALSLLPRRRRARAGVADS